MDYITDFRETIDRAVPLLQALTPEAAERRPPSGGWSPKEIIGHLIDSAANNHARFVRAGLGDDLLFPGYDQDRWVSGQAYQDAPWENLVTLWSAYNRHLAHVMATVPESARLREHRNHNLHQLAWRAIPAGEPATLDYFMRDYIGHLKHHLGGIPELRAEGF